MTHPGALVGGRYRLANRIGAGAMGVVWRARDERLDRTVALKQVVVSAAHGDQAGAAEAVSRILREGRLAARLHHPNAITVFDVTDHDGTPWLVMEYLPARSLAAVLAERRALPPHEVAAIGHQLANALAAAHGAGIVHRDVKPGNVLLGEGGVAKLTDFGISRAVDDVTVTRTGMLSGTPAYLAPEVARGAEPTPAADVFALGSTLYAAVEGQPPFGRGDNALALLHQVASGQVAFPQHAGPLAPLLMRLLHTDPAQRPTMAAARDALARVATGEGYSLHALTPHPSATRDGRPHDSSHGGGWYGGEGRHDGGPHGTGLHGGAPLGSSSYPDGTVADLPAAGANDEPRRRPALLVTVGIALAVLAALFVLAATTGADRPTASPATGPTTTADAITTTTTAAPTTTTTTTTIAPRPPTAAELQRAVTAYYALLPGSTQSAWQLLGPAVQAQGYAAYRDFWGKIDSVQALPTTANPANMTVRVLVVYRRDDRRTQAELHDLTLIQSNDALLINGDHKLGAASPPTTTRKRGRG